MTTEIVGVVPAAGRGMRAYPSSRYLPKVMFEVNGKPIIERNIELMRDKLGIRRVYVILGYSGDVIKSYLKDGLELGVDIAYLTNDKLEEGLTRSIYVAKEHVTSPFVVLLGDEVYINTNHEQILSMLNQDFTVICAIKETGNPEAIRKNYSVELQNGQITSLIEKPRQIRNNYLGCGTYVFKSSFFDYIEKTPRSSRSRVVELTDVINTVARECGGVLPFFLRGDYANVNTIEDLNMANYIFRSKTFDQYRVSVVIPALNEEKTITSVIRDFKVPEVDEILVVDGNSTDNTVKQAEEAGARVITKPSNSLPGYGEKLKYGMEMAKGDILILTEADGTFKAKDLGKILEYLKDADMVVGTRTTRQMIEQGANMDWFLRWGNVFLGKLLEVLWWDDEPRFTDVGCTYRGLWRDAFMKIKDNLRATGPEFSPEMMLEFIRAKKRVIEIPVSYHRRVGGASKHGGAFGRKTKTGFQMIFLMLKKRFGFG